MQADKRKYLQYLFQEIPCVCFFTLCQLRLLRRISVIEVALLSLDCMSDKCEL